MNREPHELGGVWMWLNAAAWGGLDRAALPPAVYHRLAGGEMNAAYHHRSYNERSDALADLNDALKDKDGNMPNGVTA